MGSYRGENFSTEKGMKSLLLVGLGNPGRKFQGTRHNVGFGIVDRLADIVGVRWVSKQGGGIEIAEVRGSEFFGGREVVLLKPMTFMNCSGGEVGRFLRKGKEREIIVAHDDLDLALGKVKIKYGGSDGGHRGLRSLDSVMGRDYWRVRVGIGRGLSGEDVEDYVVGRFRADERVVMGGVMDRVAGGLGDLCGKDVTVARAGIFVGGLG